MAPKLSLLRLPLGVFRLILDLLERNDIETFRLVSRACRYLSEHIVFRKITLHDETRLAYDINEQICDRLCDTKDALSQHVRHLRIGPLKQEAHCPHEKILVKVLCSLTDLRDFSWNVRFAIPAGVLTALSEKWPTARLHVTNLGRNGSNVYLPPDMKLLSSPQLYSLSYTVYGAWVSPSHRVFVFRSEFSILKKCLSQATKLKCLRLRVDDGNVPEQTSWTAGPQNLDFQVGDIFPALEELALPPRTYALTEMHCKQWLATMDWSHLRRLDLGHGSPQYLFTALTGRVPQLKALIFGFWPSSPSNSIWKCPDVEVLLRFLGSIDGLEEAAVKNYHAHEFDRIRDPFLNKHGRTLRKLHTSYSAADARGLSWPDVQKLVQQCPDLHDLALKIAMTIDAAADYRNTVWPSSTIAELQKLHKLFNLELEMQLDEHSTEFIVASAGDAFLIEEAAQSRAINLFRQLVEDNPTSSLDSLTVRFKIAMPLKEWAFVVTHRSDSINDLKVEKEFVGTESEAMSGRGIVTPLGGSYDPFG